MSATTSARTPMKLRPPLPQSALERVSSGFVQTALERTVAFFSSSGRISRIAFSPFRAGARAAVLQPNVGSRGECGIPRPGESRKFTRSRDVDFSVVRLALEIAAARAAGRLSRLAGRGGGTTLPGKLLATVDPAALSTLARRLPLGCALVSATNGKTTTASIVADILGDRIRLAHNRAGANLVSGVASALLANPNAELGLFDVDEGAFPDVARRVRPQAVCLGNLFRDQLDRYGELELVAERWRTAVSSLDPAASVVINVDDPLLADIARGRANPLR